MFRFRARIGHCSLLLTSLIGVGKTLKRVVIRGAEEYALPKSALDITVDVLNRLKMSGLRIMHELTYLIDRISDVGTRQS